MFTITLSYIPANNWVSGSAVSEKLPKAESVLFAVGAFITNSETCHCQNAKKSHSHFLSLSLSLEEEDVHESYEFWPGLISMPYCHCFFFLFFHVWNAFKLGKSGPSHELAWTALCHSVVEVKKWKAWCIFIQPSLSKKKKNLLAPLNYSCSKISQSRIESKWKTRCMFSTQVLWNKSLNPIANMLSGGQPQEGRTPCYPQNLKLILTIANP